MVRGLEVSVIIPTYNAEKFLPRLLNMLSVQTTKILEVIVIDSSSNDKTPNIARSFNAKLLTIPKHEFDHGLTRTIAGKKAKGDILVFITQDAVPYNRYSIELLVEPFNADQKIGASFGRQVPTPGSSEFSKYLRYHNYPAFSYTVSYRDKDKFGMRTCFLSNSFSAYRKNILETVGWFKEGLPLGEDVDIAARILKKGFRITYVADAIVMHSHNYSLFQECKRYFNIGVFHSKDKTTLQEFKSSAITKEGLNYVKGEILYLIKNKKYSLIPESLVRNNLKFVTYQLGKIVASVKLASLDCRLRKTKRFDKKDKSSYLKFIINKDFER